MLGFLSTGDAVVPGNNGFKDQQMGIRWVNENIRAFGGNPGKVTIFGESAGGISALFQLVSPLNKDQGLFHRVIAQSGTLLWFVDRDPLTSAKYMAGRLGCPGNSTEMMVECLREVPWENIVRDQGLYTQECYRSMTRAYMTAVPVVEPEMPGAFITEEPEVILRSGDYPDIPVMMGTTKHEGSYVLGNLYVAKFGAEGLDKDPEYMKQRIVPDLLQFLGVTERESGIRAVASSVELGFLDGVNRSSWEDSMPGLVDLLSVFAFKAASQNTAEILSGRNRTVYLYSFEHHSNNTLIWDMLFGSLDLPIQPGIAHADDLMYLFELPGQFSEHDQTVSDTMVDMWLNFGEFGNPTPSTNQWIRYNSQDEPYLKINERPTMQNGIRNTWRPNGFQEN